MSHLPCSSRRVPALMSAVLVAITLGYPSTATTAPITFNTALPVAEGEFVFRQQLRWLGSGDDPSGLDREMEAFAAISVLGYGVNSKLTLFCVQPWTDKSLELTADGSAIERNNQGLGDFTAFSRYTLWQKDAPGRTFRLAGFGGLTAPTGEDDASDRFGRLPPPLQNGSGAWDGFGGLVATWQTLDYQLDGQISYRANGEANEIEAGDETRLDLSWQQRLWPRELEGGVPGFLYGVLELNWLYQDKHRVDGQRDDDSGGDTLWLSPGVQYVTKRWVLEAVVQKPVSQNLNGTALENDWIATTSFRMNF
ncbi:MAG: transporter [Pseudomonadales bacterium]|nr:transporter [Pseudomonadales bacterium]